MAKKAKNLYVVVKGKKTGIFKTWYGKNGAAELVKGVEGARYKGFVTAEEALDWVKGLDRKTVNMCAPNIIEELEKEVNACSAEINTLLTEGKTLIHTDGSALNNPGPGGYGAVIRYENKVKELSGGFRKTTNNRMEMMACIEALKTVKSKEQIVLFSDSKYVVDAINKGWAKKWQQRRWMRTKYDKAENADLWAELLKVMEKRDVEFRWIRGHSGNRDNERCDILANNAAREPNLPADINYEKGKISNQLFAEL